MGHVAGTTPLSAFERVNTRDPAAAEEAVGKIFCSHSLKPTQRGAPGFHGIHNSARHDGFSVNYVAYGADVVIDPGRLDRFFLMQIPLHGTADVRCGSTEVAAHHGLASVLSPTLPTVMRWREGTAKLIILIDRPVVENHLSALLGQDATPIEFSAALALDSPSGQALRAHAMLMLALSEARGNGALTHRHLRDALVSMLLGAQPHNQSGRFLQSSAAPAPAHVKRAEDYITAHCHEPIDLCDLAARAGVSLRSLQAGFRRFRDQTLGEAITDARLGLWHDLLQSSPEGSVVTLAAEAGISHPGRAAAAYGARFGERPSDTRRRAKAH